jgi:hypothetical protein
MSTKSMARHGKEPKDPPDAPADFRRFSRWRAAPYGFAAWRVHFHRLGIKTIVLTTRDLSGKVLVALYREKRRDES